MPIGRIGFNEIPSYGQSLQDSIMNGMKMAQSRQTFPLELNKLKQALEQSQQMFPEKLLAAQLQNQQSQQIFPEKLLALQLGNKQTQQMMPLELALANLKNKQFNLNNQKLEAELPYAGEMARASTAYKTAMSNYLSSPNQALKNLSGLGKTYVEPRILDSILGQSNLRMAQQRGLQNQQEVEEPTMAEESEGSPNDFYSLQRQKMTSDAQARNRNLFATNIEKTISYIDPEALTQYGGLKGQLQLHKEEALAALGKESPQYDKFKKSLNAVKLMTKQMRQFYGDSIQPNVQESLEKLNNPATWTVNPRLGKELYDQTVDILKNELGTYRQALKTPKAYQDQPENNLNSKISEKMGGAPKGMVHMINPQTGKSGFIPEDRMQDAISKGYQRG